MEWGRGSRVSEAERISTVGVGGSYSLRGDTPHAVGDPMGFEGCPMPVLERVGVRVDLTGLDVS